MFQNTAIINVRIVSYNILAETYSSTEYAKNHMYHYIDPKYLMLEYRCQLVLSELIAIDADVICLQECDRKVFENYFKCHFSSYNNGHSCFYANKCSGVAEGCAIFVRKSKFFVLRVIDLPLKNVIRMDLALRNLFSSKPELVDIICGKLGTICQIVVCVMIEDPSRVIIIANTHLFYHPNAGYIRLLQTNAILQTISDLKTIILREGVQFRLLQLSADTLSIILLFFLHLFFFCVN